MPDVSDMELLRDYGRQGSEAAFAELVQRHINLVYSTALRHAGIAAHAEEITQAVFVILARKAAGLRPDTVLDAWLYQTTRLTLLSFMRGERRRQFREQEAYMQSTLNEPTNPSVWTQLAPLLDEAMARLGKKDREAVVLRFFKGKNLGEVAVAMETTEAAAQSRVHRAVGKLQKFFTKRGVNSTAATIAETISANSVQAAPVALAKAVTAVAIAKGATASISTLNLIQGALKIMAWTKAKTAVVVGIGILLAVGTTTITVKTIQEHKTYSWQVPKADYEIFYKMPAAIKIVPTKFTENGGWCGDSSRGAMGIAQPLKEIIQVAYQKDKLHTVVNTDLPTNKYDFFAKLVGAREPHKNMSINENWAIELQKEITKKFGITGSLEMRETDVLILKPSSAETRGFKISHTMPKGIAISEDHGNYSFHEQPVGILMGVLERRFQIPIVDQTGLTNSYDFTLKWNEPDLKQPNLDGLKQALLDQLGLELVPTNMPVEMLVVEKAR